MIELFLTLVDRAVGLARERQGHKDKLLATIDGLHRELMAVHVDYLQFLEKAKAELDAGQRSDDVLQRFGERRVSMEAARRSLKQLSSELAARRSGDGHAFFEALGDYFDGVSGGPLSPSLSPAIMATMRGQRLLGISEEQMGVVFAKIIENNLRLLREKFEAVATEYAKEKAKLV
jgi:hypothetical protein